MRKIYYLLLFLLLIPTSKGFSQPNYCIPYSHCELTYSRDVLGPAQVSIIDIEFDTQFSNPQSYSPRTCVNNGYQDFTATKKGIVEQNSEYDLYIYTEPWSNQNGPLLYQCKVWCDWNMNGEFEDTEMFIIPIDQVVSNSTFLVVFVGKIAVPANANIGETRMRVRAYQYSRAPEPILTNNRYMDATPDPNPGPCDTTFTGDTEDYGLLVYSEAPNPTEYCVASGPKDCMGSRLDLDGGSLPTKYEWHYIDTVRIDGEFGSGITNVSTLNDCRNFQSYGDYTKTYRNPPSWIPGNSYEIYVTRADDNSDELPVSCGIWIDWNNDFDFEDPDESYMDFRTFQVDSQTRFHPFNITVPLTATKGRKRLRIRTTVAQSTPRACGDKFNNGEVEDYEIFVSDTGEAATFLACIEETGASPRNVNTICQRDPQFNWAAPTDGDPPTGYYFYLGTNPEADNVIDKLDMGPATTYNHVGKLESNKQYYWKVITYNQNGEANEVCQTFTFRTAPKKDPLISFTGPDLVLDTAIICPGVQTKVTAVIDGGNGPLDYQWFGNGAYIVAGGGATDNFVDYLSNQAVSGDYSVRVTDDFGCWGEGDFHITTKTPPTTGTLNGLTTVCKYSDLKVWLTGFVGKLQWQEYEANKKFWQNMSGETNDTIDFKNVRWPRQYRVIASLAGCADTSAAFIVSSFSVPPAPRISSSIGENLCGGDTALLTSSIPNLDNVWSTEDTAASIKVNKHGLYSLYYISANGCNSDTASYQLIDYPDPPKPTITSELGFEFCIGDSVILEADAGSNATYWMGNPSLRNQPYVVNGLGKYYATAVNLGGCTATSDTVTVSINPLPTKVNIESPNTDFKFCEGGDIKLTLNTPATINWMGDAGNTNSIYTIDRTGMVFAKLISNKGCINYTDTVDIMSNPNPQKPVIANLVPKSNYCYYDSVKLYIPDFKILNLDVAWNTQPISTSDTIVLRESAEVVASFTNEFGCSTASDKVEISILDTMEIPTIYQNIDSLKIDAPADYQLYWYLDGLPLALETNNYHIPDVNGIYTVRLIDANGCMSFTDGYSFKYSQTTGITDYDETIITIAPNPAESGTEIRIISDESVSEVLLLDQTGKTLARSANKNAITTPQVAAGIYYLRITFNNKHLAPITKAVMMK